MVSDFYKKHSSAILLFCLAALPVFTVCSELVTSNNDVETWLPRNSDVRREYDEFSRTFGNDETILVAFERPFPDAARLDAASGRISGLPGVSSCWTRQNLVDAMLANNVSEGNANQRLVNLMAAPDDSLETMLITLNEEGTADRGSAVKQIRDQLAYCQLGNAVLAGGPIVGTQLDKLGSRKRAALLFCLTLLICFGLLYVNVGCWKTSGALMLANLLCINMTMSAIYLSGNQMNFILSSLPVMVMVFTTAAAIHFIGHYRHEYGHANALGRALRGVILPSTFATITTVIGLVSLAVSDIGPIPDFGVWAAVGTVFSFIIGIFLTPAILTAIRYVPVQRSSTMDALERTAMYIVNRPWRVLLPGLGVTLFCAVGVLDLRSLISPLDFLPNNDPVLKDTLLISESLTSPSSIEAMVDFGDSNTSFVERLRSVRELEARLESVDNVCHTLSLADFFPGELSDDTLSLSRLASASGDGGGVGGLMTDGSRLWRISLRLEDDSPAVVAQTMATLKGEFPATPITFTGLAPLMEEAQGQIFEGFWQSFASAFVLITIVMILALRSISAGLVAMIPNLTPILLIFGTLGWCDYAIDIGIMMTASIALGLAVDGTFHFLFSYRDCRTDKGCRYRAVRKALLQTGMPIISSAIISGTGLLALGLSPFKPTMRFGILMFCLLTAALIGDLILLPAFLAIGSKRQKLNSQSDGSGDSEHRAAA